MKKVFYIICMIAALMACAKVEPVMDDAPQEDNQEIKFNFTVNKTDEGDTKATIKTGWQEGDVVYVFLKSLKNAKYIELKRTGETWVATPKNGLVASDINGLTEGRYLQAIYLPYGSSFSVEEETETRNAIIDAGGNKYCGIVYHTSTRPAYTWNNSTSTISCSITLSPQSVTSPNKLIHLNIDDGGFNPTHTYHLCQENMIAKTLDNVSGTPIIGFIDDQAGCIPGYYDERLKILSFSGVMKRDSEEETARDYEFFIRDETTGELYIYEAKNKTFKNQNMYIGLPGLGSWQKVTPKAFSIGAGKQAYIAGSNLSYRGSEDNKWQLMKYPWSSVFPWSYVGSSISYAPSAGSEIGVFPWATSGYNERYPWTLTTDNTYYGPSGLADGEAWTKNNANWDWGIQNTVYSYGGTTALAGTWRTPTRDEWTYLLGLKAYSKDWTYTGVDDNSHTGSILSASNNDDSSNTARYRKYGRAVINYNGIMYKGLIIIPDVFTDPETTTYMGTEKRPFNNGNNAEYGGSASLWANDYTISQALATGSTNYYAKEIDWYKMEAAGAIFLPASGNVSYSSNSFKYSNVNKSGYYWSSTAANVSLSPKPKNYNDGDRARLILFSFSDIDSYSAAEKYKARSVRLIKEL